VDVFAGCGGLSLGLMQAGWSGLLAVEKDENAFATLSANLGQDSSPFQFEWPTWFPKRPHTVSTLLKSYRPRLEALRGKIDLLVGGPPCQGFSTAGRRDPEDPRNSLMGQYLKFISALQPSIVLFENVRGFTMDFPDVGKSAKRVNYSQRIQEKLSEDYWVFSRTLDCSKFGVGSFN
jgi:DNA (cytosine-5)-methyltransferase 1